MQAGTVDGGCHGYVNPVRKVRAFMMRATATMATVSCTHMGWPSLQGLPPGITAVSIYTHTHTHIPGLNMTGTGTG